MFRNLFLKRKYSHKAGSDNEKITNADNENWKVFKFRMLWVVTVKLNHTLFAKL